MAAESITRDGLRITLGEPVLVAASREPENRWGWHQFPKLSWMPTPRGRALLLTYNVGADDDLDYGKPGPAFTSVDDGDTWQPLTPPDGSPEALLAVSHSPISAIGEGNYLSTPFPRGRKPGELPADALDKPVSTFHSYAPRHLYDIKPMPHAVREYLSEVEAVRYDASSQRWYRTTIDWPNDRMLLRTHKNESYVRTSFEQPLVEHEGELFIADYKSYYFHDDGSPPRTMESLCMVSRDGGRSFERRAVMATDDTGSNIFGEGSMCVTSDGRLLSVIRRTDHRQQSMVVTISSDRGKTWSPPRRMDELGAFGVLPCLVRLPAGPMLLTYGRPGVWLSLSVDGTGKAWGKPIPVVAGSDDNVMAHSCGYTNMQVLV